MDLVSPPVGRGLGAHDARERIPLGGRRRSAGWQPGKLVEVEGVKATEATESQDHGSQLLGSTPNVSEMTGADQLPEALVLRAVLCQSLLTQAAHAKVLASACFNTSNRRFSSRFVKPVSSDCSPSSSSTSSSSSCLTNFQVKIFKNSLLQFFVLACGGALYYTCIMIYASHLSWLIFEQLSNEKPL